MQDVIPLLNGNCTFTTCDGTTHSIVGKWEGIIAFPPCTHLCVSGARWFEQKRKDGRQQQGVDFFMAFTNADCDKIAIENPVGIMSNLYRKPNQIIQPYEYGDPFTKKTCLWLKGLPLLQPTSILQKPKYGWDNEYHTGKKNAPVHYGANGKVLAWNSDEIKRVRAKTFAGIAKAMSLQWGREGL